MVRLLPIRHVVVALVLACVTAAACAPTEVVPDDAGVDSSTTESDGATPEFDATIGRRDSSVADAFVVPGDASTPQDASTSDASVPCPVCVSSSPCSVSTCVSGTCVDIPLDDATPCDESADEEICVGGACVVRGCGDGYREPGLSEARESCDDGNLTAGDGCDATCVVERRSIATDGSGDSEARPPWSTPALGVDGSGRILAVFARVTSNGWSLRAARFDRRGLFVPSTSGDGFLDLDTTIPAMPPVDATVVGLRGGGWVVAWTDLRNMTYDVVYRLVAPDGSLGDVLVANSETSQGQSSPSIAALDDGFVVAWTSSRVTSDDPDGGVIARIFSAAGVPLGDDFFVAANRGGSESAVRVASRGHVWIAAFVRQDEARGFTPFVRVRRFAGRIATDSVEIELGEGDEPSVAALVGGTYAVVRTVYASDYRGDVVLRSIPDEGPAPSSDETIAASPGIIERSPFVAPRPDAGVVVAFRIGGTYSVVATSPESMPDEFGFLQGLVESFAVERPTMTAAPDGVAFGYRAFDELAARYVFDLYVLGVP